MSAVPTVYVAVTYHGFGHVAQIAPVINALAERVGGIKLVIESVAPAELLSRHFAVPFTHVSYASDFGMVMRSSLEVCVADSHARYQWLYARWDEELESAVARLRAHRPQLLVGNVPFIPLAAAATLGIPPVALCSLNWADIYFPYCRELPGARQIRARMLEAYRAARTFITPTPCMNMPSLNNTVRVGPISRIGQPRREVLLKKLGAHDDGRRLVAVFMGGVPTALPLSQWPQTPGITWLVAGSDCPRRPDMAPIAALEVPYIDVVSSCDALVTKPGYGGFVEAGCNAIPVLYVTRDRWPEAPSLIEWLQANGRCQELPREQLTNGSIASALEQLWSLPARPPAAPSGIGEAADILAECLGT